MSTISKMETPTGQEETASLQESLKQAGRIHPNEAVILQEIKRVVEERNDLRRRLENAELLIEKLKEVVGLIDSTHAKQSPNAVNADGDGDILAEKSLGEVTE